MPKGSNAAKAVAERGLPTGASIEEAADALIAEFAGDPRAAVVALIDLVHALGQENRTLRCAASLGFARRPSLGFAGSS